MTTRLLKKMFVAGLALATAAIAVAAVVTLERLVPRGSAWAWLLRAIPVVVLIPTLMIAFLAGCDWCFARIGGRTARVLAEASRIPERAPAPRGPQRAGDDSFGRDTPGDSRPSRTFEEQPVSLRLAQAHRRLGGKSWIGQ
jgi:hypothetical protein